jgi:glycosyltransferase involved in cell wall biosynthesis
MKLYIAPNPSRITSGGVKYVIEDHLRLFDKLYTITNKEKDADLIITHVSEKVQTEPDITWTHGLVPKSWGASGVQINEGIFENIASSLNVVSVSKWGGSLIERYSGVRPHIIHNGIFHQDYKKAGLKNGHILFAKASINPTCDPAAFIALSKNHKGKFLSVAELDPKIKSTGTLTRPLTIELLKTCGVVVATTKENDSVMVMEAMATGIPILGWNWGMLRDRLKHKIGCYLAEPGNQEDLEQGLTYLQNNWENQSDMARTYSGFFDWETQLPKMQQLFKDTLKKKNESAKVSIIIPCHNYSKYIRKAIVSAQKQTIKCEIIVVDDASTDNSLSIIKNLTTNFIAHTTNMGVSKSRNDGIQKASGNFIVCLDADDEIEPTFVETLLHSMKSRDIAIAYTPIRIINEQNISTGLIWFTKHACTRVQLLGTNTIPSCCMFRKEWWERADGYDEFIQYSEDANLWLKMMILRGKTVMANKDPLMLYRTHDKNGSKTGIPPWNIFRQPRFVDETDALDFGLFILDGNELKCRQAYWRLKELTANSRIGVIHDGKYSPSQLSENYLMLEPEPNIVDTVQRKIEEWKQLF